MRSQPISKRFDIRHRLAEQDKSNAVWQRELAQAMASIGYAKFRAGDYAGALESYQQGLGLTPPACRRRQGKPGAQRDLALVLASIGDTKLDSGDNAGALDAYQQSLAIRRTLAAADTGNTDLKRDMAASLSGIGDAVLNSGDKEKALAAYEEGVALVRESGRRRQQQPAVAARPFHQPQPRWRCETRLRR